MGLEENSEDLPIIPRSYSLFIKPDFTTDKFDGSVVIHLDIIKETNVLKMNAKNLKVKKANLRVSGAVIKPPIIRVNPELQTLVLEFGTVLKFGWAVLTIHYTGLLNNNHLGLHKTRNQEPGENGLLKNFEPLSARNLFPCWDDPSQNSTFEISFCGPKKCVLSNMPPESQEQIGLESVVKFLPTPNMSADQVSIAFGDYSSIEARLNNKVIKVNMEYYSLEHGRFALDCSCKLIQFLSESFQVQFPLPKLDIVAIDDLGVDYMESWGLIAVSSRNLILPNNQSLFGKKAIITTLSRAIAHQWLGDLVSATTWDESWIIKGFAYYVATKACQKLFPEMLPWFWFSTTVKEEALAFYDYHEPDLGLNSKATEVNIDQLLYSKSAAMFVMIENYIGSEKIKDGVKLFLQRNQYKCIMSKTLWSTFESYSTHKLVDMMSSWTDYKTFPLVIVKNVVQEGVDKIIELQQERFYPVPGPRDESECWWIPLTFARARKPEKIFYQVVMTETTLRLRIPNVGKNMWIKLNSKGIGLYRVLYPKPILQEFIEDFLSKAMHIDDRISMLSDLRALVLSGRERTSTLLSFIAQLGDEDPRVWWIILKFFEDLFIIIPHTRADLGFREYGLTIFKKVYNNLGWYPKSNEAPMESMLRPLILKYYCRFEDSDALIEAKKRFLGQIALKENIHPDLRMPVYYGSARIGGEKEFNQLMDLLNQEEMESERDKIVEGIAGFQSVDLINRSINHFIVDKTWPQSSLRYLKELLNNEFGSKMVWEALKQNWSALESKFSSNMAVLSDLIENTIFRWPSVDSEAEVKTFGQSHLIKKVPLSYSKGLAKLKLYRDWLDRDVINIEKFFAPWASSTS